MKKFLSLMLAALCVGGVVSGASAASIQDMPTEASIIMPRSVTIIPYDVINEYREKEYPAVDVSYDDGSYIQVWFKSTTNNEVRIRAYTDTSSGAVFDSMWDPNEDDVRGFNLPANATSLRFVVECYRNSMQLTGEFAVAQYD